MSDQQVKRLWRLPGQRWRFEVAAAKAGMDPRRNGSTRTIAVCRVRCDKSTPGRTRQDSFTDVWEEIRERLVLEPELQAKTLFEYLKSLYPGRFPDGQVRTLKRRIKFWRATEGTSQEAFFDQENRPGVLCQSDFPHCRELGVTIHGQAFPHPIYHFVLSYSNWETGSVYYSEMFEMRIPLM